MNKFLYMFFGFTIALLLAAVPVQRLKTIDETYLVQPGAIIPYWGVDCPNGYYKMDQALTLSRSGDAKLFAQAGTTHGGGTEARRSIYPVFRECTYADRGFKCLTL